jgi:protein TonB
VVYQKHPVYPAEAKANHISGAVVMAATISKEGTVKQLEVVSGPEELRASALDAVKEWKYQPYLLNGEPVEIETTITVNYSVGK